MSSRPPKDQGILPLFKQLAKIEGLSFLLILFITMPLKYLLDYGTPNKIVGLLHGFLFVAYVFLAFIAYRERNWSFKILARVLLASVVPFGPFFLDKRLP